MTRIPSLTAVLIALALPVAGADGSGGTTALGKVAVPERAAAKPAAPARAGGASPVEGLTPTPEVIVDASAVDVIDGGTATWGFHLENNGTSPLPGPFTLDFEAFGLSNGTWSPAGWTCQITPPIASCTWPSDLAPGDATPTATVNFEVTGPYGDEVTCEGNRSPCVWVEVELGTVFDRVFTAVVLGGNHAPVAGHDTFYTRGVAGPMTLEVLGNDSDADFDMLFLEIASAPSHGTVTVNPADSTISYVPDGTYAGLDAFQYRARDVWGATDTASVLIRELTGSIAFDTPLIDIGQVETQHVAMKAGFLENTTGEALTGTITVGPVPPADVAAVLAGTGYDPALVAFDPDVFIPVDGQSYSTFDGSVFHAAFHYVRPVAPLGTVWLARMRYDLHPFNSPGAIVSTTVDVVARSATAAEAPIHVLPDAITVPPDVTTLLRPLANDDSPAGNPLSVTAIYSSDPWGLDPESAVGLFDFADPQGPNGTLPYLAIEYTPPPGYTGTNAVWYAATEIVAGWRRYDFAKISLTVAATPPPPTAVASGDATICAGGSAPLSGSGGVSCAWSPAAGLSDPASCTPAASPAATTSYSLVVTDQFGQQSTNAASVTITVDVPIAVAGGTATIPLGGSAPLTGSGGVSCAWSPAAGLDDAASCTPVASPVVTTTYALVVTSAAGCASANSATATISVVAGSPDLVVPAAFAPNQARPGDTISLTAVLVNSGTAPAIASRTAFYLSTDATLDATDLRFGDSPTSQLAPGALAVATLSVSVPSVAPAQYYLLFVADDLGQVTESIETNNVASSRIHVKRDRP